MTYEIPVEEIAAAKEQIEEAEVKAIKREINRVKFEKLMEDSRKFVEGL